MDRFGVGRPAVREALQSLQTMGLITISHGERSRVNALTPDAVLRQGDAVARMLLASAPENLEELKQARRLFELGMVRVGDAGCHGRGRGRAPAADRGAAGRLGDPAAFIHADIAFHVQLAALSGNRILSAVSQAMLGWLFRFHSDLLIWSGYEDITLAEHAGIVDAIEAHDAERAAAAMDAHLTARTLLPAPAMTRPRAARGPVGRLVRGRLHRLGGGDGGADLCRACRPCFSSTCRHRRSSRASRACGASGSRARRGRMGRSGWSASAGGVRDARAGWMRRSPTTRCARRSIPRPRSGRSGGRSTWRCRFSERVDADPGRRAADAALPGLRQPVRRRARRRRRLDRHPVMARHPVTPMDEADVGRHLARQTGPGDRAGDAGGSGEPGAAPRRRWRRRRERRGADRARLPRRREPFGLRAADLGGARAGAVRRRLAGGGVCARPAIGRTRA